MQTFEARRRSRRRTRRARWLPFLALTLLVHGVAGSFVVWTAPMFATPPKVDDRPMELVYLDPEQPPPMPEPAIPALPEEPEPPTPEMPEGQIVETPPPLVEKRPEEAEYLAEHDNTVEEETRTDLFKVNPDVLAPQYSEKSALQQEDVLDVNADKPSTGARAGTDRFDPDRDGNLASLPSPWARTNKEGMEDPVPASHTSSLMAGAPQNDLLDEKLGASVALNTKEYLYASYLNRIRRLVNFYWTQCVDNLPHTVRFAKTHYSTQVETVLDSVGALDAIEITDASGSNELDACVVQAFKVAGPYPNPPEGLIEKDGRVYLPEMTFDVDFGVAQMQYQGVDPRAGVMFPGMLKSPR